MDKGHKEDEDRARPTYPPLDVPKPVAGNVWVVDSGPMRVYGTDLPIRMTVIRLGNGDLVLHSPTRHTPALQAALEQEGRIRHLIAPNIAHWTFAQQWQQAVTGVLLWGAPKLSQRGAVRRAGVRIDHTLGDAAPAAWRGEIDQFVVEGAGFAEVAMLHRQSGTLILTDLVVNLEPAKLSRAVAAFARLAGVAAPHGGAPRYLRALILMKRAQAAQAMRRILDLQPQRIIFAHGAWFQDDGGNRLRRSLRWLLGGERQGKA